MTTTLDRPPVRPTRADVRVRRHAERAASASRDTFIDTIRTLAIAIVVLEHWLFPVVAYAGGVLTTTTALAAPGAWVTTWIGQVMPLVFFAGGAANAISLTSTAARRASLAGWLRDRVRRLAWPVLPLAAVWLVLPGILTTLGFPAGPITFAAHLVGQLVWFLAIYLVAVISAPIMLRLHRRCGLAVAGVLGGLAVLVDVARFGFGVPAGYANLLLVWLAVHQLGFAYADGTFDRLRRRTLALSGVALLGVAALLVAIGPYPGSMVGLPGAPTSNMNPPTVCLLVFGLGQISLAMAAKRLFARVASGRRSGAILRWAMPRTMTIYLWHMPALSAVIAVTVVGLGLSTPTPGSLLWFLCVPLWLGALGTTLGVLIKVMGRFERPAPLAAPAVIPSTRYLTAAVVLTGSGLLGITVLGFGAPLWSLTAAVAVACGLAMTDQTLSSSGDRRAKGPPRTAAAFGR